MSRDTFQLIKMLEVGNGQNKNVELKTAAYLSPARTSQNETQATCFKISDSGYASNVTVTDRT